MKEHGDGKDRNGLTRGAFWASAAFYVLVAFEFFYMASPFAAYFYSVYGPGLDLLGDSQTTSWLVGFFLPHIAAQTKSWLVDADKVAGAILTAAGICGFAIGAFRIYANKLRNKEMVESGVYRWIRHPQYLALMIASFGLLLIWPRFLVLFGFVTVVFVYVLLSRSEERRCRRQFAGYADYMQKTGMFLPRALESPFRLLPMPGSGLWRVVSWVLLYLAALGMASIAGRAVQSYAIENLYTHYSEDAAYFSVGKLPSGEISALAAIAGTDQAVAAAIRQARETEGARFLNYVLPTEMFVSEIPMHLPKGAVTGHAFPTDHDRKRYKIIFTLVHHRPGRIASGPSIIAEALNKTAIIEAWIDREAKQVVRTFPPPTKAFYGGMPVPVF